MEQNTKFDMNVYDEPQCEEYYGDDKYGTSRPEDDKPYGGWEGHWPGSGSGMDDFADYNAMEGGDY